MPKIRPYESQISSQGQMPQQSASPADVGGPGLTNVGQSVQSLGQHMGQVQRIIQQNATRAAITDVHTMLAGAKATYTQKALEFENQADPAAPDLWEQFYHGGDPDNPKEASMKWYLDSYREKITDGTALQTFDRGAADLVSQFGIHFAQTQSRMAGIHAKNQAVQMLDHAQVTVQADPGQYTNVLAATMAAIDDPNSDYGRAGTEQKNAIKRMATEQISKSTMQGMINQSPEQALRQLTNNTHGLGLRGEDVEPLARSAETAIRAKEVEARRVEADRLRQQKALYDSTDQSIGTRYALHEDNPGNHKFPPVTATEIGELMKQDKLDGPTGRAWLNKIEEDAKNPRGSKTDQGTFQELFKNIYRPYGDPEKLTQMKPIIDAAPKLSNTDFKFLRDEFVKARDDEGQTLGSTRDKTLTSFMTSITKSNPAMGKLDTEGDILYGQFQRFAVKEEERLRKDGKDPSSLYDPGSPEYIQKHLSRFQKTMGESIKSISENLRRKPGITKSPEGGIPQTKQRLPGETAEQYLNRQRP